MKTNQIEIKNTLYADAISGVHEDRCDDLVPRWIEDENDFYEALADEDCCIACKSISDEMVKKIEEEYGIL